MMPLEELRSLIQKAFPGDEVHLSSPMQDDNHFQLVVVSPRFAKLNMVQQHQLVYQAVGGALQ
jgi:acid stress-induced BolA-like protein IbaG/YrbA